MKMRRRISRNADVIDLVNSDPSGFETITNRLCRETRAVLDAIEAFFLDGSYDSAILDDGCRRIAVICIDSENVKSHLKLCALDFQFRRAVDRANIFSFVNGQRRCV